MIETPLIRYRVRQQFLAIHDDLRRHINFVTIHSGSIIELKSTAHLSEFVDVEHEGQIVEVFMRDVEDRCDRVDTKEA